MTRMSDVSMGNGLDRRSFSWLPVVCCDETKLSPTCLATAEDLLLSLIFRLACKSRSSCIDLGKARYKKRSRFDALQSQMFAHSSVIPSHIPRAKRKMRQIVFLVLFLASQTFPEQVIGRHIVWKIELFTGEQSLGFQVKLSAVVVMVCHDLHLILNIMTSRSRSLM